MSLSPQVSCRPAPDGAAQRSHLVFAGPCAFTVTAPVRCVHRGDDFYAYINRTLPRGFTLYGIINVESYHHPGTYPGRTEVYLEVVNGLKIYSWGQRLGTATVAGDERHLTLQSTDAPAWAGTRAIGTERIGGTLDCK